MDYPHTDDQTLAHRRTRLGASQQKLAVDVALGHSRPSHFVPVLNNVRYASDSDHSRYESELTVGGYFIACYFDLTKGTASTRQFVDICTNLRF
jgi:hypothetical protein